MDNNPRRSTRVRRTSKRSADDGHRQRHNRRPGGSREVIDLTGEDTPRRINTTPTIMSTESTSTNTETISDDDICPICQLLLHRPVTTFCNHTLCESCMATWADVSVTTQMQIVDVNEPPQAFNAVSGLEARCPMCRTQTSASLNQTRLRELKAKYPQTYREREQEDSSSLVDSNDGQIQTLTLNIGNTHKLIAPRDEDANIHEWTFFVRPSRTDIIEEVQIHLHPTFRQSRIIRARPPYEVTRLGWGFFTITAYIILKAGYNWVSEDAENSPDGVEKGMLALDWTLDFDRFQGRGSMGRLKLKVRNQRDWQYVSDEEEENLRMSQRMIRQYDMDGIYVPPEE